MVLIDSLATGNLICLHNIPDVEQTISMALKFELVVQPLFAFGEFGDFQCICCPFASGSYVKVKGSRNMFGVVQRVPGSLGSQISWHLAHESGEVVRLRHRPPLSPGNVPGTSLGSESIPRPWYGREEYVTEKSIDTTGNRSRNRPTSSAAL